MPRQDVPYGGAICRLKERIAEIWGKLDQKLHSINGVEGDGAGNVEIVSGNDAVVIANDQVGHKIEVSLDNSKLPAAAVSSVNGQTGAVRLDAADIPSDANSNVQADINWSKTAINDCFDSITTEQGTRQVEYDELQGNINAVQASIPGAAAAAVSNDPTVAQLAADVPGKLDKISSGSTLKAYTHTGQAQGETGVVNGTDANSIGLRDANGRMQAADPAAGATDKTLVTANWVSQTGDSAPNNLIHKTGNETKKGVITFNVPQEGTWNAHRFYFSTTTGTNWYKIAEIKDLTANYQTEGINWVINSGFYNAAKGGVALLSLIIPNESQMEAFIHSYKSNIADMWSAFSVKIGKRSDKILEVFAKGRDYTNYSFTAYCLFIGTRSMSPNDCITPITPTIVPEPQESDYDQLITVTI